MASPILVTGNTELRRIKVAIGTWAVVA